MPMLIVVLYLCVSDASVLVNLSQCLRLPLSLYFHQYRFETLFNWRRCPSLRSWVLSCCSNPAGMFFCPFCGTLLLFSLEASGSRFFCQQCAYAVPLSGGEQLTVTHDLRSFNRVLVSSREAEGTTEGDSAAPESGGQIISIRCPNTDALCKSNEAFFVQTQIRSADEPASIFYKCVSCGHTWRQD